MNRFDPAGLWDIPTGYYQERFPSSGCVYGECGDPYYQAIAQQERAAAYADTHGLPANIEAIVKKEAANFGIPWQVLAGLVKSEREIDVKLGEFLDTGVNIVHSFWPPGIGDALYEGFEITSWGTTIVDLPPAPPGSIRDPGPGYGNVHISTAYETALYFQLFHGADEKMQLPTGSPSWMTRQLARSYDFNIKYIAAIVRKLADYRFFSPCRIDNVGRGVPPTLNGWTLADTVAIWHAYRYGIRNVGTGGIGFKDLSDFTDRSLSVQELIDLPNAYGESKSNLEQASMLDSIPIFEYYLYGEPRYR